MEEDSSDKLMPIDVVLNELDEFTQRWNEARDVKANQGCRRDKHRRGFRADCDVWYFEERASRIRHQTVRTRNLSEHGIGFVAKCVIHVGTPIEILIGVPDREPTYLGGVVVFCRYTSHGLHEVGVRLRARQQTPIFSDNSPGVVARLSWVQDALRAMIRESKAGKRLTGSTE